MSDSGGVSVRFVMDNDETEWCALYRGYREFYRLEPDESVVSTTWGWIRNEEHAMRGLVAEVDGIVVGLANVRRFARPSSGTMGIYVDDLFTAPEARRGGVGVALLREIAAIASQEGCSVVRWITADTNVAARSVYDAMAKATPWVTYDMAPTAPE